MKKETLQGKAKTSRVGSKISWGRLTKEIKEAQKDPQFMAEIRRFVKVTTS
ncbi:hypothetical protein J4442_00260 [Candidatus Woesearchaeota archaeon]|nr:hypothetical protein [Candidatus Woesearchaeota archaeon]